MPDVKLSQLAAASAAMVRNVRITQQLAKQDSIRIFQVDGRGEINGAG